MTRSYQYSPAGNITTKDTEHGAYTYQYDELYRLTQAINPTISDEAYTYDLLGNRLTSANTTGSWTYNVNNELGGYDNVSYVYDANGNLTNKTNGTNSTNYIYDVEDRLVRVEDGSGTIISTYYYDPFGRRLWKEVDGTRTYFLYSDEGLIGEYDSTGNEIKTYGWTPDSIWGTDPLFLKINGYYYFYQNDHQGTPQKLIGTNGMVVWAGVFDSFGNCQVEVAGITNNLRFAGQYYDSETGLHCNWLRYYDPGTGRYLSTDPFGEGLNLYVYVFSNPHFWIDPYGLCAVHAILAAGGMIPAFGIVPDLLDSFLYLVEGEYSGAALAGLAAIPVLGQITRGAQFAKKSLKYGDDVADLVGAKVYRVWGDKAGAFGKSWTTIDPGIVSNYRKAAGLPDVNTGRFVSEGILSSTEGVKARDALKIKPGQTGGLPEIIVPDPKKQIELTRVSGVNPEF